MEGASVTEKGRLEEHQVEVYFGPEADPKMGLRASGLFGSLTLMGRLGNNAEKGRWTIK